MFCRVRPLLPEDGVGTDMAVCYPTSTEALGRSIELVQSGIYTRSLSCSFSTFSWYYILESHIVYITAYSKYNNPIL